MGVFQEPKIDCHVHVLDPVQFPYGKEIDYHPAGQEIGTTAQLHQVMKTYGVSHALLVQPNSGYGSDNACMLDAIAHGEGRFKGIAIIDFGADDATLRDFKRQGIVGAAFNPTFHGNDYYRNSADLIERLAANDMFLQLQVEQDQFEMFAPWIEAVPVKVLIDHCGRPTAKAGLGQAGFRALLRLARTKRVSIKLSGYMKFSNLPYPFEDTWPFVRALVDAFGLEHCMWASDWPFLRAPRRQDYGPLVELAAMLFPNPDDRRVLFRETAQRLFGFPTA